MLLFTTVAVLPGKPALPELLDPLLLETADAVGVILSDGGRDEERSTCEALRLVMFAVTLGKRERSEFQEPLSLDAADNVGVTLPGRARADELGILVLPLGGCGKDAILIGFRKVFRVGLESRVAASEMDLMVGMFEVELACCGNRAAVGNVNPKGGRSANLEEPYDVEGSLPDVRVSKGVVRLLLSPGGKGGRAACGGLREGRDGCGRVAAMSEINRI